MPHSRKSLEPSVFQLGSTKEEDRLIGSRCKECGRYFFPGRKWCASCAEPTTEEVVLSKEGSLSSFSIMTRKTKYALIETPYVLGEVKIPEGLLIYTVINTEAPEKLQMGQKVTLDSMEVKKDDEGNSVVAYNFEPAE
ncbi:MAG: OB-fold domain-containing protein [Pseudomonadota bacterium]